MKIRQISQFIAVLIIGFLFGSGVTPSQAENAVIGEVLTVCINKKTGIIRVASKCATTERKTILGGVGAKGDKGDKGDTGEMGTPGMSGATGMTGSVGPNGTQGPQGDRGLPGLTGAQGLQGFTGATGATGSMSGLRTTTIQEWSKDIFGSCSSFLGISMLSSNTSLSQFSNTISLNKSCVSMSSRNVTVYAP